MGTSNFYYKDELFAVETDDEHDHEILTHNISYRLEVMNKEAKSKNKNIQLDIYGGDTPTWTRGGDSIERNFPSMTCGQVVVKSTFMGLDLRIDLDILVRNGYYGHANIDYTWQLNVEGIDFNEDDGAFEVFKYSDMSHFPEGLIEMNRSNLDKRLEDMRTLALEVFTFIGKTYGTEHAVAARFSNGETMYSKVESEEVATYDVLDYQTAA